MLYYAEWLRTSCEMKLIKVHDKIERLKGCLGEQRTAPSFGLFRNCAASMLWTGSACAWACYWNWKSFNWLKMLTARVWPIYHAWIPAHTQKTRRGMRLPHTQTHDIFYARMISRQRSPHLGRAVWEVWLLCVMGFDINKSAALNALSHHAGYSKTDEQISANVHLASMTMTTAQGIFRVLAHWQRVNHFRELYTHKYEMNAQYLDRLIGAMRFN